ncbi:MAG: hypothetical protein KBA30_00560 [Clostridia bacterium]|nr:hypothetical protein [Clostridia bacterium]
MSKTIAVLGSTGSIGTQTLEVAASLGIRVAALAAGRNAELLAGQIVRFHPRLVSMAGPDDVQRLRGFLETMPDGHTGITPEILFGDEGTRAVAICAEADTVVAAMVGIAGLRPVLDAIRAGKQIALANKETLVAGGSVVLPLCARHNVRLLPVDSEHSAIWQCLWGNEGRAVRRILLTASGGPFLHTRRRNWKGSMRRRRYAIPPGTWAERSASTPRR